MTAIKAAYSHQELADLSGLSRHQVARLVESKGIETVPLGRKKLVPLVAFRNALPEIWASILVKLDLARRS